MKRIPGRSCFAVLALAIGVVIAGPAHAGFLDDVKGWLLDRVIGSVKASPEAKALHADLERYRAESRTMEPRKAADAWLALYDRAKKLGGDSGMLWDAEAQAPFGLGSMLGALPAPEAWPLLRDAAKARAQKAPEDAGALALRLVTELLTADRGASAATLAQIDALAKRSKNGDQLLSGVAHLRAELAQLYGTPEEIAATFVAALDGHGAQQYGDVEVPDLVGLVGEAKATAILREALAKPIGLRVPEGAQTRALARRIALERNASLAAPQWGLVDAVEAGPLYEAINKRFKGAAAASQDNDYRRAEADRYYFLYLVVNARHAEAEKAMERVAGRSTLYLPKREVEALRRAGQHEALYNFLHVLLARRPEMNAWDVYMREAAAIGKAAQALELVERLLARKDLAADVLAGLRFQRVNALLAADRVEPAVAELRDLLAQPPKKDEPTLRARTDGALRLAGLGRVLERRDVADAGLAFARAALVLQADRESRWGRADMLRKMFAELRKAGREEEALSLAKAELERKQGSKDLAERYSMVGDDAKAAVAEIVGIQGQAKRYKEVFALLDESPHWGARDLRDTLGAKDSLGVPVGLTAARALAESGRKPQAIAVTRALIEALPGHDPAYELLLALDPDADGYLNKVYAADKFEERPLIWKAILYTRGGRWLEAESLIRQAITIDPSDGEEGPNDRMRAYSVLAEVLEAKGAKAQAAIFRGAVEAIRISERTDELHSLGLYERAFAGYRQALAQFADAYCIQSRLAIRLTEQGRREEAFEHYRRAYELMPASFGRVESHCFGCESVFQGAEQQTLAERVFNRLLAKDPGKPQIHYLLGYLNKERGRLSEAAKRFGESVRLDPEYLNAWKHLHELGKHIYLEPRQRDRARFKLLELDPRQRHVRYDLDSVGDLAALWNGVNAVYRPAETGALYPLRKSAQAVDAKLASIPESVRGFASSSGAMESGTGRSAPTPYGAIGQHKLMKASVQLLYSE
jgi:tetratricopeptide (TPR) repeat protein